MKKLKCALLIIICFIVFCSIPALAENAVYKVRYGQIQDGAFVETNPDLAAFAEEGTVVTTASIADRNGKRCYWKVRGNGGVTKEVVNGGTFRIYGNTRLTPVWKKLYTIRLFKYDGTKERKKFKITLAKGEKFKLPEITSYESKVFYGWSKAKNAAKATYKCNKTYTVSGNMKLYEVVAPKKKYTVYFWSQAGGSEYKKLRKTVYDGSTVKLPVRPNSVVYTFRGWSQKKDVTTPQYKPGEKITVRKNLKLYAVFVKNPNVAQLKYNDGKAYKTIVVDGKTDVFPSVAFYGKTLQGWSTKKGQKVNAQYMEGDIIPKKAATYYMVVMPTPSNSQLGSTLKVTESSKYAYVYFVGDSRMAHANNRFGNKLSKTRFVPFSGSGYDWLVEKGGGYAQLINKIKSDNRRTSKRKAVIFCHGINDLTNINKYIAFYDAKAKELKSLGCDLYLMSANQFCGAQRSYYFMRVAQNNNYTEKRTYKLLRAFNTALKNDKNYTYIDIYTYLNKTGWPTADLTDHPIPDGLHYTQDTTKRIVTQAIRLMDAHY